MATLIAQPARIPMVDPRTGLVTREWQRYFEGLYGRVGGAHGDGTGDLSEAAFDDAGTEEQEAALYAISDAIHQQPTAPTQSPAQSECCEVSALREEVAMLRQQINDIKQGVQI